ncbi:Conserved_hypothetical protein [Hexamita inflata]|uniref:Uncharacterized protein n=1 Tax=Hexamita inflata TaxID=28002 RepID=A0AA86PHH7_9EUKA|nr:Conserved hypothetical protein [Hexamita inflata]
MNNITKDDQQNQNTEITYNSQLMSQLQNIIINVSDPLTQLAAGRLGIDLQDLTVQDKSYYQKQFNDKQLAQLNYDVQVAYYQECMDRVRQEIKNINDNGIQLAEFIVFDLHPSLRHLTRIPDLVVDSDHLQKFINQLKNEGRVVRKELERVRDTQARLKLLEKQAHKITYLSDKDIAIKQNLVAKEVRRDKEKLLAVEKMMQNNMQWIEKTKITTLARLQKAEELKKQQLSEKKQIFQEKNNTVTLKQTNMIQNLKNESEQKLIDHVMQKVKKPPTGIVNYRSRYYQDYKNLNEHQNEFLNEVREKMTKTQQQYRETHQYEKISQEQQEKINLNEQKVNYLIAQRDQVIQAKLSKYQSRQKEKMQMRQQKLLNDEIKIVKHVKKEINLEMIRNQPDIKKFEEILKEQEKKEFYSQMRENEKKRRVEEEKRKEQQKLKEEMEQFNRDKELNYKIQQLCYLKDELKKNKVGSREHTKLWQEFNVLSAHLEETI